MYHLGNAKSEIAGTNSNYHRLPSSVLRSLSLERTSVHSIGTISSVSIVIQDRSYLSFRLYPSTPSFFLLHPSHRFGAACI